MFWNKIRRKLAQKLIGGMTIPVPGEVRVIGGVDLRPGAILSPSEAVVENYHGGADKVVIGENSYCRNRFLTYGHGGKIRVGQWCYIGARTEIWSMDSIEIGDRALISHGVNIHDGAGHSMDPAERHEHFRTILTKGHYRSWEEARGLKSAPVVIEDDVWINFGAIILKGVRIGRASVIAAGAIVTKDVPPESVYLNDVQSRIIPLKDAM
jgi:maltose O-acetyltransferase